MTDKRSELIEEAIRYGKERIEAMSKEYELTEHAKIEVNIVKETVGGNLLYSCHATVYTNSGYPVTRTWEEFEGTVSGLVKAIDWARDFTEDENITIKEKELK